MPFGESPSPQTASRTALPATESKRDEGLLRVVGPWGFAANIVNAIIGAGIFAVPGALAGAVGPYAPLAFLVCAFGIGSVAICFAEGGSRIPTSGGAYGYIEAAFGPLLGFIAGTLLWLSNVLACAGVSVVLADAAVSLLPQPLKAPAHAAVIVIAIGGIALVNIGGIGRGTRLVNAATTLKLIPLVVFIVAGAGAIHSANFVPIAEPNISGLGRAVILALFAFTGMEVSLNASGEVAEPSRTIPRALTLALISVTLIYIGVQVVAQGILGETLAHSTVPLADAMARVSPPLRFFMLFGAALSMFGVMGSHILGTPRILFAFARDGMMPRVLGRIHKKSHAPHVAILCYSALAIGLAISGTFAELAVLAALCIAVIYILGCAAAWRLARGGVALAGELLHFRWLGIAAVTGSVTMAWHRV